MKRSFAALLAVLMVASLLAACGDANDPNRVVKTSVDSKYDDGFAKNYANTTATESDGKTVYQFSGAKYDEFIYDYSNDISGDISSEVAAQHEEGYGQYSYINVEKQAVYIGLNPGEYDEEVCAAEAPSYADKAFKLFMSLEKPVKTIKVLFCNAGDQEEIYGSFEFTAE